MTKQLKILGWKFFALVNPACWTVIKKYDRTLDQWLLQQLASGEPIEVHDYYSATLGGVRLWTANAPYSCGYPDDCRSGGGKFRPSRAAMLWLSFRVRRASTPEQRQPDARQRQALHKALGKGAQQ